MQILYVNKAIKQPNAPFLITKEIYHGSIIVLKWIIINVKSPIIEKINDATTKSCGSLSSSVSSPIINKAEAQIRGIKWNLEILPIIPLKTPLVLMQSEYNKKTKNAAEEIAINKIKII